MATFDFEYEVHDLPCIVEVEYFYDSPDPYALDSDWDFKGGMQIESVKVFVCEKELEDVFIPREEIIYQFQKHLRDLELTYAMEQNLYY